MNAQADLACKRCKRPLHLDTNLEHLKNIDDLNLSLYPCTILLPSPVKYLIVISVVAKTTRELLTGAESGFEMILPKDEGEHIPNSPAASIERPRKLANHTTSKNLQNMQRGSLGNRKSETHDRSLCAECTEVIVGGLEAQIEELETENMLYQEYLDQLTLAEETDKERGNQELQELEAELMRVCLPYLLRFPNRSDANLHNRSGRRKNGSFAKS